MNRAFLQRLKQSVLVKNVLVLVAGTGAAQAITIAATPILTRLYAPEDFGVFALFSGIISIISVVATARYELAIMLPKADEDAGSLTILSILIAGVVALIGLFAVVCFNKEIVHMIGTPEVSVWLYLLPIAVFFVGTYQALNLWSNRNKRFSRIAVSGVSQSGASVVTQIVSGANVKVGPGGLIGGLVLGYVISTLILFRQCWVSDRQIFKSIKKADVERNARSYIRFPKYSMFGALVNSAATQMPVFVLSRFFSAQVTGVFSITFRALNLPMSLMSSAISQVLFQKIVSIQHENPSRVRSYIIKTALILTLLMVPFVLGVWMFGEDVFVFVLGEKWRQAGQLASVLSVAIAIRFVVSPLSSVLAMEHNVRLGVLWQVIYFVTISATLLFARNVEITEFLVIYVVHDLALYSLYFLFILLGTKPLEVR